MKLWKKVIIGMIGLALLLFVISSGGNANGGLFLTYVYSNSMEPLIKVNDAFIVRPATDWKAGDIIIYRPQVLNAPYITHRIIGIGESGFITKGDNSPYADQESGEPEVKPAQIAGKVVTINGQPLIFPGLGKFSAGVQQGLGKYSKYLSYLFIGLAILSAVFGKRSKNMQKPRHRIRLGDLYRMISITASIVVVISIYLGSQVTQVKYLVSEYPGTLGDQVEVGEPGQLIMKVKNNGVFPVWNIITGIKPVSLYEAPDYLWPLAEGTVTLELPPQYKTGYYQGYVQVFHYPILLPRNILFKLHGLNPVLAMAATGISIFFWCSVLFQLINYIPGYAKWIPLKAIKDKMDNRRIRRFKIKYLKRRGVRMS